ncbi:hypothetical protein [Planktothrix sp. FACHB-1365]|uniref:hypothetical protein n=1 Tax=Planktothrix sp. FACHB-1365 TaxID=2692855 RepID=UPI001687CBF3|nr:hypothetical protein [Planktothrix sp. FACHB-1365]MBD2482954.1 hypothetical protein [Planktothrix sp. FACHB-1365]
MKKLLTSIAGAGLFMVTGLAAPSQAGVFGVDSTDLNDVLNKKVTLTTEQANVLSAVSKQLKITSTTLLKTPSKMGGLYTGTTVSSSSPPTGALVYSKNYGTGVCKVQAGCALKAIGLSLTLQCSSSGTDPEAWAKCVKSKDNDKYLAASQCTWGTCPGFATLPNGGAAYACTTPTDSVFAGKSLLNLPTTLNNSSTKLSLPSQG